MQKDFFKFIELFLNILEPNELLEIGKKLNLFHEESDFKYLKWKQLKTTSTKKDIILMIVKTIKENKYNFLYFLENMVPEIYPFKFDEKSKMDLIKIYNDEELDDEQTVNEIIDELATFSYILMNENRKNY